MKKIVMIGLALLAGCGPVVVSPDGESIACNYSYLSGLRMQSSPADFERRVNLKPGQTALVEVTLGRPVQVVPCPNTTVGSAFRRVKWTVGTTDAVSVAVEACPCSVDRQRTNQGEFETSAWIDGPGPIRFLVTALKPGRGHLYATGYTDGPCDLGKPGQTECGPWASQSLDFVVSE